MAAASYLPSGVARLSAGPVALWREVAATHPDMCRRLLHEDDVTEVMVMAVAHHRSFHDTKKGHCPCELPANQAKVGDSERTGAVKYVLNNWGSEVARRKKQAEKEAAEEQATSDAAEVLLLRLENARLTAVVTDLEAQNKKLQEENRTLQESTRGGASTPQSPSSSAAPCTAGSRWSKRKKVLSPSQTKEGIASPVTTLPVVATEEQPPTKRRKKEDPKWLRDSGLVAEDLQRLRGGKWLNTSIIRAGHKLLRKLRHPRDLAGLELFNEPSQYGPQMMTGLQVCHTLGHWVLIGWRCDLGIYVVDSMGGELCAVTQQIICRLYPNAAWGGFIRVNILGAPIQSGSADCGLFALAAAYELIVGWDLRSCWDQPRMRPHLEQCLEAGVMTRFPVVDAPSVAVAKLTNIVFAP